MSTPFDDVQRIVLRGSPRRESPPNKSAVWQQACHLMLRFEPGSSPHYFLHGLAPDLWPTRAGVDKADLQVSLGFSRPGLQKLQVPDHVLANFASKAPAFYAGAAVRGGLHCAATGSSAPSGWNPAFAFTSLDAVLTLHATEGVSIARALAHVESVAAKAGVNMVERVTATRLRHRPDGEPETTSAQWVHFGYRDGLSRIGIHGLSSPEVIRELHSTSLHQPGEFVLGHMQDSGANPWIAGPGRRVWSDEVRSFFRNGSFGVLQQIEQDIAGFEAFVTQAAKETGLDPHLIKAKLCGRYPDGRPLANDNLRPEDDFAYDEDTQGTRCPYGSHVRRMNPRDGSAVQDARRRALLRRGMPYGSAWPSADSDEKEKRGLIGHFFCASIEDQFEHLIAQWADRVPLGSADRGGARDPLFGAHEAGDGPFEIPRGAGMPSLPLRGLRPFTRTLGTAYLFYPSVATLRGIADSGLWGAVVEDDD